MRQQKYISQDNCKPYTMAGVVFHVEFGFNETSLTRALESGNYARAEKIIRDSNNPSSLDEGKSNSYKILLVFDL